MRLRALQGLRPTPATAPAVAAVPYDVVDTEEARALAEGNPLSLLHVTRAEIDFPEGTDPHSDAVYRRASENLHRLEREGALIREKGPCLYLYRLTMGPHQQTGLAGLFHIDDYASDVIRKHERTRRDKEDDRTRTAHELNAHVEPVFLAYRDDPAIDRLVQWAQAAAPLFDLVAPDGVRHTLWRVAGVDTFIGAFGKVPVAYVADGHHRSASAARVGQERRSANPRHTGEEPYNWFPAVIFPASQLRILAYNRRVLDLNGHSAAAFLDALREVAPVTAGAPPEPRGPGEVSMYLGETWYSVALPGPASDDPVARLDVSVLQDRILGPVLGIDDPRTSQRIEFIGGIRGTGELEARVRAHGGVAFSMAPVTMAQLMSVADAGRILPPKSTWFEPKLRSGFFIHALD
ncbi:MAG: DUF1015 domain-containing protein [Verrucomicrobiae bacterium]|nr:DUF1015 domain-containing protein [Verrucomicrobiae bacterium]